MVYQTLFAPLQAVDDGVSYITRKTGINAYLYAFGTKSCKCFLHIRQGLNARRCFIMFYHLVHKLLMDPANQLGCYFRIIMLMQAQDLADGLVLFITH